MAALSPSTGQLRLLGTGDDLATFRSALRADEVLVHGTRVELDALARTTRLGAVERDRRASRRRQQKASRRTNRKI